MIREQVLLPPHRRPMGQPAAAVTPPPGSAPTPPERRRLVGLTPGLAPNGLEAGVITRLLEGDPRDPLAASLLDTLASLTAEALQQAPNGAEGSTPAEVRGVAARIATGLAVALLESDLADRITARLAEEAPFAEGWRSCPE
jgi:hypothetical protein